MSTTPKPGLQDMESFLLSIERLVISLTLRMSKSQEPVLKMHSKKEILDHMAIVKKPMYLVAVKYHVLKSSMYILVSDRLRYLAMRNGRTATKKDT